MPDFFHNQLTCKLSNLVPTNPDTIRYKSFLASATYIEYTQSKKRQALEQKYKEAYEKQDTLIPFGKYKGKSYIQVAEENYKYFEWAAKVKEPTERMRRVVEWYVEVLRSSGFWLYCSNTAALILKVGKVQGLA